MNGHLEGEQPHLGDLRSLLTTYKSWDDPPSIEPCQDTFCHLHQWVEIWPLWHLATWTSRASSKENMGKSTRLKTLPETNSKSPWKSIVGRWISFWGPAYFQGLAVSFREGNCKGCKMNMYEYVRLARQRNWDLVHQRVGFFNDLNQTTEERKGAEFCAGVFGCLQYWKQTHVEQLYGTYDEVISIIQLWLDSNHMYQQNIPKKNVNFPTCPNIPRPRTNSWRNSFRLVVSLGMLQGYVGVLFPLDGVYGFLWAETLICNTHASFKAMPSTNGKVQMNVVVLGLATPRIHGKYNIPTWHGWFFDGKSAPKYTSPMDPVGHSSKTEQQKPQPNCDRSKLSLKKRIGSSVFLQASIWPNYNTSPTWKIPKIAGFPISLPIWLRFWGENPVRSL